MKKSVLIISGIVLAVSGMSFMTPASVMGIKQVTYKTGALPGYTGSPGDKWSCVSCHNGTPTPKTGWITSDVPTEGYMPGQKYTITAMVEKTGITKFGFEVSPQDMSGNVLGTLGSDGTTTQLVGQGKYVTHRLSSTAGTDSKSWTFDWTAPAAGTGDVTFYGAFNAANDDDNTTGDMIFTSQLLVKENPASALPTTEAKELGIYPNPSHGSFRIRYFLENGQSAEIRIMDMKGSLIHRQQANYLELSDGVDIDLTGQPSGIYFVQLSGDHAAPITKKIVVQ